MKQYLKWLWFLNKRLYKKGTFVVLLLLIPLLTLFFSLFAKQSSGFAHIALAADGDDPIARAVIDELLESSEFIRFTECATTEEAARMVRRGDADGAWLFPADLTERIGAFSKTSSRWEPALTVVEREETIPLRLSHEKLSCALYKYCSRSLYVDFVRGALPELDGVTEEDLLSYYDDFRVEISLFAYESANSSGQMVETNGYLLAPVRGLLSVVAVLAGLAAALFFMRDEQKGNYSFLPYSKKPFAAFACGVIAVLNLAVVMLLSLYAAGLDVSPLREVGALLLFAVSGCLFGMLLQQITGSIRVMCALLPLLAVVMIAVCPIFFNLKALEPLQLFFPPTYYIRSVYRNEYFLYTALYCLGMAALYALLRRLRRQAR